MLERVREKGVGELHRGPKGKATYSNEKSKETAIKEIIGGLEEREEKKNRRRVRGDEV